LASWHTFLDFIGKSGVFAAYATHGVVPIVLSDKQGAFEGCSLRGISLTGHDP